MGTVPRTDRCVGSVRPVVINTALTALLSAVLVLTSLAQQPEKTRLTVLLYPWVPDFAHIAKTMEQKFELENSTVDLVLSEQNWDYYKPGGLDAPYDIYELDGIYLNDFVRAGRIQPLDKSAVKLRSDVLRPAADSVMVSDAVYGTPHWVCALFTFHFAHDTKVATATTRADLAAAIGSRHERGRGLLVDWKGHSTLAELYADCLLDLGLSPAETLSALQADQLHPTARSALEEVIGLSDPGTGRSDVAHKAWPPYYALEFAHGRGRALVGYSERMHHILEEIVKPTDPTPVIDPRSITVKLYNQGDRLGVPLLWVDSFAIAKEVTGAKLDAACKFLAFAVRDDIYRAVLLPPGKAPQYLLPAYSDLFTDPALKGEAPLYPKFLPGLENATSLAGLGLPQALEKTGELLDKKLPANLEHQ